MYLIDNLKRNIIVDPVDIPLLEKYLWDCASGYATTLYKGERLYLHKLVANSDAMLDHVNRNKLDNRRCNLRLADLYQNAHNKSRNINNTSGYKGVSKHGSSWRYEIMAHGIRERASGFNSAYTAALAYDAAARKYHKEFACLNFPDRALPELE